jgi:Rap1a immunity proteins
VTRRLIFTALIASALWPCAALAIDGNELLQSCAIQTAPDCTRYIAGVVDALRGVPYFAICPPNAADYRQMVDVAVKKLRDQPDIRHYNAAHVVGIALRAAFPCKKPKGALSRR